MLQKLLRRWRRLRIGPGPGCLAAAGPVCDERKIGRHDELGGGHGGTLGARVDVVRVRQDFCLHSVIQGVIGWQVGK